MTKTELHWVFISTLPGWRTTKNSWTLSHTGSMKFWQIIMMFISSQWHKLFNGSKIHVNLQKSKTLNHGRRGVQLIQTVHQPVGYQTPANWHQRKCPVKHWTYKLVSVVQTTIHGSTTQLGMDSSKESICNLLFFLYKFPPKRKINKSEIINYNWLIKYNSQCI